MSNEIQVLVSLALSWLSGYAFVAGLPIGSIPQAIYIDNRVIDMWIILALAAAIVAMFGRK